MKRINRFVLLTVSVFAAVLPVGCDDRMYEPTDPIAVESVVLSGQFADGYELVKGRTVNVAGQVAVFPVLATNKMEEFTSSNTTVATVDQAGEVKALEVGTAVITITVDGQTADFKLTVIGRPKVDVTSIALDEEEYELEIDKETLDLLAHIRLTPMQATWSDITFTSLHPAIATVDEMGVVTPVSVGEATITVVSNSDSEVKQEVTVNVIPPRSHPDYTIVDGVVTEYKGAGGEIEIPYWATSVSAAIFKNNTTITKVNLNNVTTIVAELFSGCTAMTEISAPKLTGLPNANVFNNTPALKIVRLPVLTGAFPGKLFNGNTVIEELALGGAFANDNLQNMTALKKVDFTNATSIGSDVFRSATALTEIRLGASLTAITGGLCSGAGSLLNFEMDPDNSAYKVVDGVIYSKDGKAIVGFPGGRTGSFKVPDGVTVVNRSAFAWSNLTSLDLNNVTDLKDYSIYNLKNLTSVNASKVKTAVECTFWSLPQLKFIALPSAVSLTGRTFRDHTDITIDLSQAAELTTVGTTNGGAVPDKAGITIYVANDSKKALFKGTLYKVIVGAPPK